MATWPAGIEIGDPRIAAGEPITQDLEHDFRDRDDLLKEEKLNYKYFSGAQAVSTAAGGTKIVLDNGEWRDRWIQAWGGLYFEDTLVNAQTYLPGGANDQDIMYGPIDARTSNDRANFNGYWMYSSVGGVDHAAFPRIRINSEVGGWAQDIYVEAVTGDLCLHVRGNDVNSDNMAWNLWIIYSEDIGAY